MKSRIKDLEDELARVKANTGSGPQPLLDEIQSLLDENRDLKARLENIRQLADGGNPKFNLTSDDAALLSSGQPEASAETRSVQTGPALRLEPISPPRGEVDVAVNLDTILNPDDIRQENEYMTSTSHEANAATPATTPATTQDIAIRFPAQNADIPREGRSVRYLYPLERVSLANT